MKKIFALILSIALIFGLAACGNTAPKADDTLKNGVKLPLDGFYGYDNGLLLKVDYKDFLNYPKNLSNPQDALYYNEGELYRLEAEETTITLNSDITSIGTQLTFPIKYYIYNDTVYPYFSVERTQVVMSAFFKGIKGDTSSIIIYDAAVKYPIIYNLKDNTYNSLYDGFSFKGYIDCISNDGKYIMVAEIDKATNNVKYSVLEINSGEAFEIPLPNELNGYKQTPTPYCFVGDKLILKINFATFLNGSDYVAEDKMYEFDIKNGNLTEFTGVAKLEDYTKQWDFIFTKSDTLEGEFSVYNFNNDKTFCFDLEQPAIIAFSANETGEYAFGSYAYYDVDPVEFDQDGNPVFFTPTEDDYKKIFWNFKDEKEIDIEKQLKYNEKYKDYARQYQWIAEKALLVTYISPAGENQEFHSEIVKLP